MPLSEQHRARLDDIVSRMEAAGESPDSIKAVIADYTTKVGKLSTPAPAPDSMGTAAVKSAAGTVVGAVKEPLVGLKDLASTVIHDPELLRGSALEGLLPGGHLAVAAGKAIAGQSIDALKNATQPGIEPIERISHLLSAVPLVGPAAQQMGMKLGVGSTFARPTGEAMSAQDQQTVGQGIGEVAGNAALLGMGRGVKSIGEALAKARGGPAGGPTPLETANRALGVKPKNMEAGRNPGIQALKQGIDLQAPTREIVTQIGDKLNELTTHKKPIALQQWSVGTGDTLFEEQLGGDATHKVNTMLDEVVSDATRLGDKKLATRAQRMMEYVQDSRGKPLEDLTYQEADDLAHDIWRLKRDYFGGKQNRPLAAALERVYGVINEALPPPVRELNTQIRDLVSAQDAAKAKLLKERASHGPPPIKDVSTLRRVIRHTPTFTPAMRMAKLLERMIPGGE